MQYLSNGLNWLLRRRDRRAYLAFLFCADVGAAGLWVSGIQNWPVGSYLLLFAALSAASLCGYVAIRPESNSRKYPKLLVIHAVLQIVAFSSIVLVWWPALSLAALGNHCSDHEYQFGQEPYCAMIAFVQFMALWVPWVGIYLAIKLTYPRSRGATSNRASAPTRQRTSGRHLQ
jgi:hypothetical protein